MSEQNRPGRWGPLARFLHRCRGPAIVGALLLLLAVVWFGPRRVEVVIRLDIGLLAMLASAALAAAVVYLYHTQVRQALWPARFFVGGVLVNLLLVMLLVLWKLPDSVERFIRQFEAVPAAQVFDDNQHQSHEDGRAAYEKVADLRSVEPVPLQEMSRQETEPLSVPRRTENPLPTIPVETARQLPSERLLFVPPEQEPDRRPKPERPALSRRPPVRPATPLELAEVPDELLRDPVADPVEMPLHADAETARLQAASPSEVSPEVPRPDASAKPDPVARPHPHSREPGETQDDTPLPPVESVTVKLARRETRSPAARRIANVAEEIELTVAAAIESETAPVPPEVAVAPVERSTPLPSKPASMESDEPGPSKRTAEAVAGKRPTAEAEASSDRERPVSPPARLARSPLRRDPGERIAALETEPELELAAVEMSQESSPEPAAVELARNDEMPLAFDVRTPQELTGPASRVEHRIVVGSPADERNDAPPTFSPIASRLHRKPARARRVAIAEDNVGRKALFTLRQGDERKQHITLFGGTDESEQAVERGLQWLAEHQNPDGSWSLHNFHENCDGKHSRCSGHGGERSNTAATGLALLPFLGAGHTHLSGEYRETVAQGLGWLAEHQQEDGNLLGPGDNQMMYSHGIAAIALCEAWAMTEDPDLRPAAQKSLDFIVQAQHAGSGGWRYQPNQSGDTSVVGWQVMALKSGELAGLSVPPATFENTHRWLASVEANQPAGGTFGYVAASPTPTMTAEGLLCLQFLGVRRNDPRMRAGADYLMQHVPRDSRQETSYYRYYAIQVMYHMQGEQWDVWNETLRDELVETQIKSGPHTGTWDPHDPWEQRGGRVYATALKLLMLEVYYRHLPLYEHLGGP